MCQGCDDWQEWLDAVDQFYATVDLTPFTDEEIAILNGTQS